MRAAIVATLVVVTALLAPCASAETPSVSAKISSPECWGKRHTSTLRHVLLFNNGGQRAHYAMTWQLEGSTKVHKSTGKIPPGQGVNEGFVLKPDEVAAWVKVSAAGWLVFSHPTPWAGLAKCERRAK